MSGFHLYVAQKQPAIRYTDDVGAETLVCTNPPSRPLWVECCNRERPAKNCSVQVYYDCTKFWCVQGKGCKSKVEIATKRNREFRNRSQAMQKAWARRRMSDPAGTNSTGGDRPTVSVCDVALTGLPTGA